jgi:hypothetical protein
MRQSKLFIAAAIITLCYALQAKAQQAENIFCPDFQRTDLQGNPQNLYNYLSRNKMVFLVAGDIRQSATRDLLQSYSLQKLTEEHGPATNTRPYTSNDIQVIFLQYNADLPGAADVRTQLAALPFPAIVVADDDDLLPQELTDAVAPTEAGVFLVTPDHLARPVHFTTARDAYHIATSYRTAYKPAEEPDVRVTRCIAPAVAGDGITTTVYFQNYSNQRLNAATVQLFAGDQLVTESKWNGNLAPLETAGITLNGKITSDAPLHITVQTAGDRYLINNSSDLTETRRYTAASAKQLPYAPAIASVMPATWNTTAQKLFSVVPAGNQTQEAVRISFSSMLPAQRDTLFIGNYNLGQHAVLNFSRAYAPSSELSEANMTIIASADEGKTWTVLKSYDNEALTTTHTQSYTYQPRNGHEWIKDHVHLSGIGGKNNVWLAIVATADYTNDAYVSNISLADETPVMAVK